MSDPGDRFAGLVRAFELHGGRLADHCLDEWAQIWVIAPDSVRRELQTHLARVEATWMMTVRPSPAELRILADAPDALAAFESMTARGRAPPTFRLFRRVFLESGAFPELSDLIERDSLVWELARIGQGPRACARCVGETGGVMS
jgi:hypothetical protein